MRASRSVTLSLFGWLCLGASACTPPAGPPDPFSGGLSPAREGVRTYRVRFEVACDHCQITYMIGPQATHARGEQVWSENLRLTPLQRTALRVTAAPEEDGRPIRYMRIIVDGDVVAEQSCGTCRDRTSELIEADRTPMSVETVIPRG